MDRQSLAQHQRTNTRPDREQKVSRSCNGHGLVLLDAEYDPTTGELVQEVAECFVCKGEGTVSSFLYATPRRRQ